MRFTEPEVVAGVGREALEPQAFVVGVLFPQEAVRGQDSGALRLGEL